MEAGKKVLGFYRLLENRIFILYFLFSLIPHTAIPSNTGNQE